MRILIYLLAMLTGFSAADAARPVATASPAVNTAIARSFATVVVKSAEQAQVGLVATKATFAKLSFDSSLANFATPGHADTPVLRHDVILG